MQNHKLAGRAQSVKKSTVRMVENHLAKQRNAYDSWIQELCADAEEAAAERDRLKAKLAKLRPAARAETKRRYNQTIKIHQMSIDEEIKMLRNEVSHARTEATKLEEEAQARADEAAAMAMGNASESQRKLILKIMTKLIQGAIRLAWTQWDEQTFGAKRQKIIMTKILKRLLKGQLSKGFTQWKLIATKWDLVQKIALKDRLVKELDMLERKAKEFEQEAESRQEAAMQAALSRCSGEQKELLVKILSKMTGNLTVFAWTVWSRKVKQFNESTALVTKIMCRMINMKKHLGFRRWFEVCMAGSQDKFKIKEELLMSQRDQLLAVLRARAEQLEKLQAEAAALLEASQRNAADTANVMQISTSFADNVHVILDKKALDEELGITDDPNKGYAGLDLGE